MDQNQCAPQFVDGNLTVPELLQSKPIVKLSLANKRYEICGSGQ